MFKAPSSVPQDLLLIHNLVSTPSTQVAQELKKVIPKIDSEESSIASSNDGSDSEDSIEKVDRLVDADIEKGGSPEASAESSSEDSSSDDDSDSEPGQGTTHHPVSKPTVPGDLSDDDDENEPSTSTAVVKTKNEVIGASTIPDFTEVSADEILEKVGEVMNIVENVVIVKGDPSAVSDRASERALDSDSILVFEDRKVLGYIYETFGPTSQPFYQVKFPSASAVNTDIVKVSKTVFHVPGRSKFVFPGQIRYLKGSDASNFYDEEVAEDEAEFSDDEKEAAFKAAKRRSKQPGSRASSVLSSRGATPNPSHMRDQEIASESFFGVSPYDEYSAYNMDTEAGPSRPAPLPYDDPYADQPMSYEGEQADNTTKSTHSEREAGSATYRNNDKPHSNRGQPSRGRGRGRDRGRGRGGRKFSDRPSSVHDGAMPRRPQHEQRSLSPASLAIARATGHYPDGSIYQDNSIPQPGVLYPDNPSQFTWQQSPHQNQYVQSAMMNMHPQFMSTPPMNVQPAFPGIQPHINPRFAAAFGINMNFMQQQQGVPFGMYGGGTQHTSPVDAYNSNVWSVPVHSEQGQQTGERGGAGESTTTESAANQ